MMQTETISGMYATTVTATGHMTQIMTATVTWKITAPIIVMFSNWILIRMEKETCVIRRRDAGGADCRSVSSSV